MVYSKSRLYLLKLVSLQKYYIFLFFIEYFEIFHGKTQSGGLSRPKMKN